MSEYLAQIHSTWSIERTFEYMSDFSNAQFWDPSVRRARHLYAGGIGVGSLFELVVRFAGRDKTLTYRLNQLEPARRVVFSSSSGSLRSIDTVTFEPRAEGCVMTYHAELYLTGPAALANPVLAILFRRLGDRAKGSLQRIMGPSGAATA